MKHINKYFYSMRYEVYVLFPAHNDGYIPLICYGSIPPPVTYKSL